LKFELWLGLGYSIDLLLVVKWFLSFQVGDSWPEWAVWWTRLS